MGVGEGLEGGLGSKAGVALNHEGVIAAVAIVDAIGVSISNILLIINIIITISISINVVSTICRGRFR